MARIDVLVLRHPVTGAVARLVEGDVELTSKLEAWEFVKNTYKDICPKAAFLGDLWWIDDKKRFPDYAVNKLQPWPFAVYYPHGVMYQRFGRIPQCLVWLDRQEDRGHSLGYQHEGFDDVSAAQAFMMSQIPEDTIIAPHVTEGGITYFAEQPDGQMKELGYIINLANFSF